MENSHRNPEGRSAEEVLRNGRDLMVKQNKLSSQDFEAYTAAAYYIDVQRGIEWINIVKKLGDHPERIKDFSETALRKLAHPSSDIAIAERIISRVLAGEITSSVRSVYREFEKSEQKSTSNKEADEFSFDPKSSSRLNEIKLWKRELEAENISSQRKIEKEQTVISQRNTRIKQISDFINSLVTHN